MNEIMTFNNKEFGSVREITIDEKPWFVGKDVASALGYQRTADAIKAHVYDEDKLTRRFTDSGQSRDMIIVNESGMYALIFGSKLESAKRFKHWVTSDVLPSIRKTGSYTTNKNEQGINSHLLEIVNLQQREIDDLKNKNNNGVFSHPFQIGALHYVLRDHGCEISHLKLFKQLRDDGYLEYCCDNGQKYNVATKTSIDLGLMEQKTVEYVTRYHTKVNTPVTYVTLKGQNYFIDKYCNKTDVIASSGEGMKPMQFCQKLRDDGVIAKPGKAMQWMRDNDYLVKEGRHNIPTERSLNMGLMKDDIVKRGNNRIHHVRITDEGQEFFKVLLM